MSFTLAIRMQMETLVYMPTSGQLGTTNISPQIKSRFSSSDGLLDQMNGDDVQLAFKTQDLMTEHVTY